MCTDDGGSIRSLLYDTPKGSKIMATEDNEEIFRIPPATSRITRIKTLQLITTAHQHSNNTHETINVIFIVPSLVQYYYDRPRFVLRFRLPTYLPN